MQTPILKLSGYASYDLPAAVLFILFLAQGNLNLMCNKITIVSLYEVSQADPIWCLCGRQQLKLRCAQGRGEPEILYALVTFWNTKTVETKRRWCFRHWVAVCTALRRKVITVPGCSYFINSMNIVSVSIVVSVCAVTISWRVHIFTFTVWFVCVCVCVCWCCMCRFSFSSMDRLCNQIREVSCNMY